MRVRGRVRATPMSLLHQNCRHEIRAGGGPPCAQQRRGLAPFDSLPARAPSSCPSRHPTDLRPTSRRACSAPRRACAAPAGWRCRCSAPWRPLGARRQQTPPPPAPPAPSGVGWAYAARLALLAVPPQLGDRVSVDSMRDYSSIHSRCAQGEWTLALSGWTSTCNKHATNRPPHLLLAVAVLAKHHRAIRRAVRQCHKRVAG